jgi:hypothetical protein
MNAEGPDALDTGTEPLTTNELAIARHAGQALQEGRRTFRFDTFGDEEFWGGMLQLHKAIEGAALGGVGPGVSPRNALALGLKIDVSALPRSVQQQLAQRQLDLDSPATTLALLKLDAVVGLTGFFKQGGTQLRSIGIQCALCHSTVDQGFSAPGIPPGNIGQRLDGWANRDLNVGAIVASAPNLQPIADLLGGGTTAADVTKVLLAWGPGKFDAELLLDGKGFRPDGKTAAVLIPPAFGLAGVNLHTWTGWGSIPHWNAFVAVIEMHGKGRFFDPRLNDPVKFPVAKRNGFADIRIDPDEDRVSAKLPALHIYQLAIPSPKPPEGSFFREAANRGRALFEDKAKCIVCHTEGLRTEPGWNLHTPAEIGVDGFQAMRGPENRYRTSPLGGLWTHEKGGFFHDGRFATLLDVVDHYDRFFRLGLTAPEKSDLVEYLKSL